MLQKTAGLPSVFFAFSNGDTIITLGAVSRTHIFNWMEVKFIRFWDVSERRKKIEELLARLAEWIFTFAAFDVFLTRPKLAEEIGRSENFVRRYRFANTAEKRKAVKIKKKILISGRD